MRLASGLSLAIIAVVLVGCGSDADSDSAADPTNPAAVEEAPEGDDSAKVTEADFGDEWPFTVSEGIVRCDDGIAAVTFEADGNVYALNGDAIGQGIGEDIRQADIWKVGSNVAPGIERGLELCG